MSRGRHIKVKRQLYWHHGIEVGDGSVIHASGEPGRRKLGARVRRGTMDEFLRGGVAVEVESDDALPPDEVVARAEAAVGLGTYSLLWNNCEHFARACHTGRPASVQVTRAAWITAALLALIRVGVGLAGRSARSA